MCERLAPNGCAVNDFDGFVFDVCGWLRSYVSDEYGMSDTEAGNLYAAYGFACTGRALIEMSLEGGATKREW